MNIDRPMPTKSSASLEKPRLLPLFGGLSFEMSVLDARETDPEPSGLRIDLHKMSANEYQTRPKKQQPR